MRAVLKIQGDTIKLAYNAVPEHEHYDSYEPIRNLTKCHTKYPTHVGYIFLGSKILSDKNTPCTSFNKHDFTESKVDNS